MVPQSVWKQKVNDVYCTSNLLLTVHCDCRCAFMGKLCSLFIFVVVLSFILYLMITYSFSLMWLFYFYSMM